MDECKRLKDYFARSSVQNLVIQEFMHNTSCGEYCSPSLLFFVQFKISPLTDSIVRRVLMFEKNKMLSKNYIAKCYKFSRMNHIPAIVQFVA